MQRQLDTYFSKRILHLITRAKENNTTEIQLPTSRNKVHSTQLGTKKLRKERLVSGVAERAPPIIADNLLREDPLSGGFCVI